MLTRSHPHHRTGFSLTETVSSRHVCDPLVDTVEEQSEEAESHKPPELVVVGIRDEGTTRHQDNGHGEKRSRQEDREQRRDRVDESRDALENTHLLDQRAEKTEIQLSRSLNGTNSLITKKSAIVTHGELRRTYPASALLEVTNERFRDSSELQGLVNVGSLPASTKEHAGRADVFRERASRKATDLL